MDPIDADHLADELRLVVRGQENGGQEIPAGSNATPDAIEGEVVGSIIAEWSLQREHLITMLKAYRDRLAELTAGTQITQLEVAASFAITKFKQRKQEARGDLADLAKRLRRGQGRTQRLRTTHNLARPARNRSGRWTTSASCS